MHQIWVIDSWDTIPEKYHDARLELLTPQQIKELPDGTTLVTINGREAVKGKDRIDLDTRAGYTAYGRIID